MKLITTFFIAFFLFNNTTGNTEIVAVHDITSITVFLNSAEIVRTSKVLIPKGKSNIIFNGISAKILKQGMKVSLSNNVTVYAMNIDKGNTVFKDNKEWQLEHQKFEKLKTKGNIISVDIKTLQKELLFLEANMTIGNTTSIGQIDERAVYFKDRVKALYLQILKKENEIKEVSNEIEKVENKLGKIKEKIAKVNAVIRITVTSEIEIESAIELKYLVSNAIWKPTYSIRTQKEEEVTIQYQANIYNDTGNDWNLKPITLAVMNPLDDITKPILDSWVLDEDSYDNEGRMSKAKGNFKRSENTIESDYIEIDDLSTRFEIKDLHLIPSDATPHLIDVKTFVRKADFYTLAIPKVKDGAFSIASIHNWQSMGLLEGSVSLYYKNNFQGVSQLNLHQIGNTLDVSLGNDKSYTVTRRKLSSMSREKLIGINITDELTYEILVRNNKSEVKKIELRDQLPISVDKSVDVEVINISKAKLDKRSGQLTWKLQLQPNETKRLILKFKVTYPKKKRGILSYDSHNMASPRFF